MNDKILVTGGSGLVGNYLKKYLPEANYLSSTDYDLTKESQVIRMYNDFNPKIVIHLAAKVGGIIDNINKPAEYFTENILMNTLLVDYAYKHNVNRFIGVLSTCIYPDTLSNYPLSEENIHSGPPTETNFSYGYAKRALATQIESYNKQYGTKYQYLIPCNLYGVGYKDDEHKSHFITALVKKIYDAKKSGKKSITLFGDGTPIRQFMFADDLAKVIYITIQNEIYESFNVATKEILTIEQMVKIGLEACNSESLEILWDTSKPNGQFRKDVSISKLERNITNFQPTPLKDGIKLVYDSYNCKTPK